MNALLSLIPWLQPDARVGRRGPSRFNGFPARLGGTGYQPVPLGNLPNGMGSALECSERLLVFQRHRRSVRQVAGRHRLVTCATRVASVARLATRTAAIELGAMWTFPDAKLPSENQRRALSRLAYVAFLDMRILGREGKGQQVADLAEAFHNLPLMLWTEDFSMSCQRDFLQRYQEKHGVHHPSFDYLAEFEKIAAMTE